jgi:hypothetical protein
VSLPRALHRNRQDAVLRDCDRAGGLSIALSVEYVNNVNAGTATASAQL